MGGHAPVLDEILRSATQSDRALRESRVGILRKQRHGAAQDEVCVRAKRGGVFLFASRHLLQFEQSSALVFAFFRRHFLFTLLLINLALSRTMANPNREVCPDYALPEFDDARLLFTVDGKTDEEAATLLKNLWNLKNTKEIANWERQRAADAQAVRQVVEFAEQEAEQR